MIASFYNCSVIMHIAGHQLGWGERAATCRPASELSGQQQSFAATEISSRWHCTGKRSAVVCWLQCSLIVVVGLPGSLIYQGSLVINSVLVFLTTVCTVLSDDW